MNRQQDLPPREGFGPSVPYKRHIPQRGPPGWVWLSGVGAIVIWGFWMHSRGLRIKIEIDRERLQARFHLQPLLMAEEDQRYLRRQAESLAVEERVMGKVPGWVPGQSVYHTKDEWIPQIFFFSSASTVGEK